MTLNLTAPEPLNLNHRLDVFSLGEETLDHWLKNRAMGNQKTGASRTFVTASDNTVMGYYALSTGIITTNQRWVNFGKICQQIFLLFYLAA